MLVDWKFPAFLITIKIKSQSFIKYGFNKYWIKIYLILDYFSQIIAYCKKEAETDTSYDKSNWELSWE